MKTNVYTWLTESRAKCGALDAMKWGSMPSASGVWRVATIMSLAALLMLLLLPRLSSAEPLVIQIPLEIRIYPTQEELNAACSDVPLPPNTYYGGCSVTGGAGMQLIFIMAPKSWCDWARIETLGHEVMHSAGWHHSKEYKMDDTKGTHWRGVSCEFDPNG